MALCRLVVLLVLIAGCQTTHEDLIAKGYPPAFADGFDDGCSSGRQAAGAITGEFRKNVPRYLKDKHYAEGWSDGFRQCQAMRETRTATTIAIAIGTTVTKPGNNRRIRTPRELIARNKSLSDIQ